MRVAPTQYKVDSGRIKSDRAAPSLSILLLASGEVAMKKCEYCDGHGYHGDDVSRGEKCTACNGTGDGDYCHICGNTTCPFPNER